MAEWSPFPDNLSALMRTTQKFRRACVAVSRVFLAPLLVLAVAPAAEAMPRVRHARHSHVTRPPQVKELCNPRAARLRKAFPRRRAVGPVRKPSAQAEAGLTD